MRHPILLTSTEAAFVLGLLRQQMDEAAQIVAIGEGPAVVRAAELHVESSEVWEAILLSVDPPRDEESTERLERVRYMREAVRALLAAERGQLS